jgi:hypothetical protein
MATTTTPTNIDDSPSACCAGLIWFTSISLSTAISAVEKMRESVDIREGSFGPSAPPLTRGASLFLIAADPEIAPRKNDDGGGMQRKT